MKKSFWIYLILTIFIMVSIFFFSSQDSDSSTDMSMNITEKIVNEENYQPTEEKSLSKRQEEIEVVVRKTAHILIYTTLGFCVFMTIINSRKVNKNVILFIISLIICIIYASSDEIHQLYVSGRSGEVRDVLIDSAGSAVGILVAMLMCIKRNKSKNKADV